MVVIPLPASSLSGACGMNPYNSVKETSEQIVRKYFKTAAATLPPEELVLALEKVPDIEAKVKTIVQTSLEATTEQCDKLEKAIIENINKTPNASAHTKEVLEKHVKSSIATARGVKRESSDLNSYERKRNVKVCQRNKEFFRKMIDLPSGNRIELRGMIDGRDPDGSVIETKRRRSKLFRKIPLYEKVQLEAYMWLTNTRAEGCTHVENYENESVITAYTADEQLWKDIITGLETFEKEILYFLSPG